MDRMVERALAKWPNVPAAYGWLALDRRGRWLLKGRPVTHPGTAAFFNRNYLADPAGRWYVQNGPQRAYVNLAVAPQILALAGDSGLRTHTGARVTRIDALVVDEDGDVLLATEHGLGLVCDRDLPAFVEALSIATPTGVLSPADSFACLLSQATGDPPPVAQWHEHRFPIRTLALAALPGEFGFDPQPEPTPDSATP